MFSFSRGIILAFIIPAVLGTTYDVAVGLTELELTGFAFNPPFVHAQPGDIVNFVFHPKNHSVTQSAFDTPCVPLEGGFNTGFVPVATELDDLPTLPFTVPNTTSPTWFHCAQTGHCQKGMVFAINPPDDPSLKSFSSFQALANGTAQASSTTDSSLTPAVGSASPVVTSSVSSPASSANSSSSDSVSSQSNTSSVTISALSPAATVASSLSGINASSSDSTPSDTSSDGADATAAVAFNVGSNANTTSSALSVVPQPSAFGDSLVTPRHLLLSTTRRKEYLKRWNRNM